MNSGRVSLLALAWGLSTLANAHHSPAMFASGTLTLSGTVREFQWTNPHSYIQLLVKPDDGPEQEWSIEMGSHVYLYNLGWRPSTVKAGDKLIVTVRPLRNGTAGGLLVGVTKGDGNPLGVDP